VGKRFFPWAAWNIRKYVTGCIRRKQLNLLNNTMLLGAYCSRSGIICYTRIRK